MPHSTFRIPGTIHYGPGALAELAPTARGLSLSRVLLVTDAGMVKLGLAAKGQELLETAGFELAVYAGVQPDPTLQNVEAGLAELKQFGADGIVALGGGSVIDCAKAVSVRATNPVSLQEFIATQNIPSAGVPLIAVPTTAGTGSEVTRVMVLTDTERDVKMMFASRYLIPSAALVDPNLTLSMPRSLTAAVGVDALTHALEAYVSRRSQPMTDLLALSAIRLISQSLRTAYDNGEDLPARSAVMLGAMQAGMAFSNASVALIHGMARPLGACFHLPHGVSIGILLPIVTEYSYAAAPDRYDRIAARMDEDNIVDGLRSLNRDVGMPTLRGLNIDKCRYDALLEKMAQDAIASGSPANNPRPAAVGDIVELYQRVYEED